jgi:hypothetical protein
MRTTMSERDVSDYVREEQEAHPERFRTVRHACGHEVSHYFCCANIEAMVGVAASLPCVSCTVCEGCGQKVCACPDPFREDE